MLVALEYGGHWRADSAPHPDADLIMIIQVEGEDPLTFARRFLQKILAVIAQGAAVTSAVLAVAPDVDARHLQSRCTIARNLLRVLRPGPGPQLHLVEPTRAPPECRAHLLALAEVLLENSDTECEIRAGYKTFRSAGASLGATTTVNALRVGG